MDLATIVGLVLANVLVIVSILLEGSLWSFYSLSSIMITVGGSIASTMTSFSMTDIVGSIRVMGVTLRGDVQSPLDLINTVVRMAERARREGLLALEADLEETNDEFLRKGIQLIVDGTDPELVRNVLETEISMMEDRHKTGASIMSVMATMCPAYGMLGTLIGLIMMLGKLDDPSSLGPGMAVALITTFYGSYLANVIFIPMGNKLKYRSAEEILNKEIIVEGVLSIAAGENPRLVTEKLKSFLYPHQKIMLDQQRSGGGTDNG
jgi:chemotaxis protein MotA